MIAEGDECKYLNMSDLIEFSLFLEKRETELGTKPFQVAPRVEDCILLNEEGKGQIYQVTAVLLTSEPNQTTAGRLILKRLGTEAEIMTKMLGMAKPWVSVV